MLAACATGGALSVDALYVPPVDGFAGLAGESDLVVAGDVVAEVSRINLDSTPDSPTSTDVVTYEVRVLTPLLSRPGLTAPVAGTTIQVRALAVDGNAVDRMTSASLRDFADHTGGLPVGRMAAIALREVGDASYDVIGRNAGVLVVDIQSVSSLRGGHIDATNVEWYLNIKNSRVDGKNVGRTATLASLLSEVQFRPRQPEPTATQDAPPAVAPNGGISPTTTTGN